MRQTRFFKCTHCGNIAELVNDSGAPLVCCGENMQELIANTVEASKEKHIPVVVVEDERVSVTVGAAEHPMIETHYIEWIYLETENGSQRKFLSPGDAPNAVFTVIDDKPLAVYAYCNIHGLWKKEL